MPQDAPFDVRAFDRIELEGEEGDSNNKDGISESVIFSEPSGGNNCSSNNPHFRGGTVVKSLNGSVVHYRDVLLDYGLLVFLRTKNYPNQYNNLED